MESDGIGDDGFPLWPAAERNKQPILEQLARQVGTRGGVFLEIASGTGQHALHFARGLPRVDYVPSDVSEEHLATLRGRVAKAGLANLKQPVLLDVCTASWPVSHADFIYCANMIHIAPFEAALGLLAGAGRILAPGGLLFTYGPYRIEGEETAPSNERFDASLRERDPRFGVRDLGELERSAKKQRLRLALRVRMPANNFFLVWEREEGLSTGPTSISG
jgi:SAM-dependent methyltransferase